MAEYLIDKAYLVALADAIRKKSESSSKMTPSAMVSAINNLGDMTYTPQSSSTIINKTGELYTIQDTTFNSLANAIRNKADIGDKMTPHKMIDVVNGFEQAQAFAVYSADDKSLNFYKRSEVPKTGGQFEGKTATAVYTGIETEAYGISQWPSWSSVNNKITKVEVVDKISPISTAYWFANFYNLTSLDISKLDTSNVTDMSGMFQDCSSLTTLDVSSLNTSKVTNMDGMFKLCSSITTLDASGFDTSRVTNMEDMFDRCTGLTAIALSGFDTALVTNMGGMFQDCSSLTTLNLSSFDTSNVTDMSGMFQDCSSLTTLDVSGFCMPNIVRVMYMYDYCSKLQRVKVGEKYNWKGINGYLPVPNASYIPGADGKWYALSDGKGYAPENIPSNKADTYVASQTLLPSASIPTNAMDAGDYIVVTTNNMNGADLRYEWHCVSTVSEIYGGLFNSMQSRRYKFKVGSGTHASITVGGSNAVRNGIEFYLEDYFTGKVIRSEFLYENATTNFYLPAGTYDLNIVNHDPYTHSVSLEFINSTNEILDETTDRILTSKAESNSNGTILYCVVSDASGKYLTVNTNDYVVGSTSDDSGKYPMVNTNNYVIGSTS